jgi:hypothetical protein
LIFDKIKNAKTSDWLSEGLTEEEIKEAISEAKTERDKERKGIFTLIKNILVHRKHVLMYNVIRT